MVAEAVARQCSIASRASALGDQCLGRSNSVGSAARIVDLRGQGTRAAQSRLRRVAPRAGSDRSRAHGRGPRRLRLARSRVRRRRIRCHPGSRARGAGRRSCGPRLLGRGRGRSWPRRGSPRSWRGCWPGRSSGGTRCCRLGTRRLSPSWPSHGSVGRRRCRPSQRRPPRRGRPTDPAAPRHSPSRLRGPRARLVLRPLPLVRTQQRAERTR
jgi:hypothetical protein